MRLYDAKFRRGIPLLINIGFSLSQRVDGIDQRHNVASRPGAAPVVPGAVINHLRHVVINDEPGKAHFLECADSGHHIDIAFTQEAFVKLRHTAFDIAEMDVKDFAAFAKVAQRIEHALAAALVGVVHFRKTPHAEIEAMIRAGHAFQRFLKASRVVEQTRDPA